MKDKDCAVGGRRLAWVAPIVLVLWGTLIVANGIGTYATSTYLVQFLLSILRALALLVGILVIAFGVGGVLITLFDLKATYFEVQLFSLSVGLGVLSLAMFALGALHLYRPGVVWPLFILGVVLSAKMIWSNVRVAAPLYFRNLIDHVKMTPLDWVLVMTALGGVIYSLVVYTLVPPLSWDEIAYHVAIPKLYIASHGFVAVPYIAYSQSPFNMEMLYTLALLLGSDILPHLVTLTFSVALCAALVVFSSRLWGLRAGLIAAALYWNVPAVQQLSGVALVEIGLALYTWMALYALHLSDGARNERWLVVAGLMSGFAAGSKLTGALVPLVLGCWVLGSVLVRQGVGDPRRLRARLRAMACFILPAIVLVVPWYLKSWLMTGNPTWPFLYSVFGGTAWDATGSTNHLAYLRGSTPSLGVMAYLRSAWFVISEPYRFGSYPLGSLVFWLAPVAPLIVFRHRESRLPIFMLSAFCVMFYTGWFFLTHQTRFLLPMVPVLCILATFAAVQTPPLFSRFRPWRVVVVLLLVMELPYWNVERMTVWVDRLPYLRGQVSKAAFLSDRIDVYDAFSYCNEALPSGAKLLLFPYENRAYYLDVPYVWGNLITQRYVRFEEWTDHELLWHHLRSLGITHILDKPGFTHLDFAPGLELAFWPEIRAAMDDLEQYHADLIYEHNEVFVYALKE